MKIEFYLFFLPSGDIYRNFPKFVDILCDGFTAKSDLKMDGYISIVNFINKVFIVETKFYIC